MTGSSLAPRRPLLLGLTALAWFGVILQCVLTLQSAIHHGNTIGGGIVIFLGYFTILTNLLVCLSLTMPLVAPTTTLGKVFCRSEFIAGVATSILFVGISYHVLLRNTYHPQGLSLLANVLLHYIMPILYMIYWWFYSPKIALRWIHPLIWGVYPTAYLIYALIRGEIIGNYPYAFIDAAAIGYERTIVNGFGLLFCFIALGLLLVAADRVRRRD
jgi:hypothetical protein